MKWIKWWIFVTMGLGNHANGEPTCVIGHQFSRIDAGKPPIVARVAVIAGKPIELLFKEAPGLESNPVKIFRVTGLRRLPVGEGVLEKSDAGWTWKWEVPVTRGPANYEAELSAAGTMVVRIEARDPEWLAAGIKFLKSAKWEGEALTTEERSTLTGLGMRVVAKGAPGSGPALLRVDPATDAGGTRRELVLDDANDPAIVWRPGIGAGDWRIRIPRAWISKSHLSTDEGLIRLVDLLVEQPGPP